MSELKLCPFCGKKPNPNWTDESYIECTNRKCSVYGYGMSTGDWNTRPIEDDLRKRIAGLKAWINKFIAEGEYLSLLNGLVNGDSDWGNLVADYWKERDE